MTKPKALKPFMTPADVLRRHVWPKYLMAASRPDAKSLITSRSRIAESGCWEWTGTMNSRGYPVISVTGANLFGHRLSLLVHGVSYRPEDDVDHLCRNTKCVNPEHLEPVTHRENVHRGNGGPRKDGLCGKGHDDWRYYPTTRLCDTCSRIRKGRALSA